MLQELKSHFRRKLFQFLFPGQEWADVQRWLQQRAAPVQAPVQATTQAEWVRSQPDKFFVASDTFLMETFRVDFFAPGHKTLPALTVGSKTMLYNTFQFEAVTGSMVVGDRCCTLPDTVIRIGPGTGYDGPNVWLGNDVFFGPRWVTDNSGHSNDIHRRVQDLLQAEEDYLTCGSGVANKDWTSVPMAPVRVEDHAWIGRDAVIFQGVTVGIGAIVGAYSVVTRDVEPWTVVSGNPARVVWKLSPQ